MHKDQKQLQSAVQLHQQGRIVEAISIYEMLIKKNPSNYVVLHLLGIVKATLGQLPEARVLMERSLALRPTNISYLENYVSLLFQIGDYDQAIGTCSKAIRLNGGTASLRYTLAVSLYKAGRLHEAIKEFDWLLLSFPDHLEGTNEKASALAELKLYDEALSYVEKALKINPRCAEAFQNKGNILAALRNYAASVAAYKQALEINPKMPESHIGCANALRELRSYNQAITACDHGISLNPNLVSAWLSRGNILRDLNRHEDAFAAYEKALALAPRSDSAWLGLANVFFELKRYDEALAAYDKALALNRDLEKAWLGRGNVFYCLKCYDQACSAYDRALSLSPDLESAWLGRGNVWVDLKNYEEAFAAYDRALSLKPGFAEAWLGRGNGFSELKRYKEAFEAYDKAQQLKPDLAGAEGLRLHTKMHLCDWSDFEAECAYLLEAIRSGQMNSPPFAILSIPSSPGDQLAYSKNWLAKQHPPSGKPIWLGERYDHRRIRIAYLSADFCEHPVSYLIAGMFEAHDKTRFETIGISFGPGDNSDIHNRIKGSLANFVDCNAKSDRDIAHLLREMEIDIAIDLMGFTQNCRPAVFASRAVPIQVNYLGYPGTLAASYFDYVIADNIIIPPGHEAYYGEKIVRLPDTFQPTGFQAIADHPVSRVEIGLPGTGFVFCCFNNHFKIAPSVFLVWMRILKAVEGSVLWLRSGDAADNLRRHAKASGVDPNRLIFAPRLPRHVDHLARHSAADLFLDTLPYNAHTTASEALWTGVPVLTCLGETFAGRVAASLLNAMALPELVTTTLQSYEQMAIDLAKHPEQLARIKGRLARNRLTTPLFDTKAYTKHIEAAFTAMHERHRVGLTPDHIAISAG